MQVVVVVVSSGFQPHEKAIVGAFSVIIQLQSSRSLFEALLASVKLNIIAASTTRVHVGTTSSTMIGGGRGGER